MQYRQSPRRAESGFTLVELLVTVVIIGILSSLAFVSYGRYVGRARTSEAAAILAEMTSKEQTYFMEFGHYLPLRAGNDLTRPSASEVAADFYPVSPSLAAFNSRTTATIIANAALWPGAWRSVGLRPRTPQLFCTYMTNAGDLGQTPPGAATDFGPRLIGAASTTPWFFSLAACNLLGASGFPASVTVLALASTRTNLSVFNEGL